MIIYIVIRLEKCVLQMAKQPVKYIIICCPFLLVRELTIAKIPLYDLSERSVPYITREKRNSIIIDFLNYISS